MERKKGHMKREPHDMQDSRGIMGNPWGDDLLIFWSERRPAEQYWKANLKEIVGDARMIGLVSTGLGFAM